MDNSDQHTPPPDPYQRIEELENHVQELSGLVEDLLAVREDGRKKAAPKKRRIVRTLRDPAKPRMVDGVRDGVERAIGGKRGESLESRVGAIWFSRLAAALMVTAIVLGIGSSLGTEDLPPEFKIGLGYLVAAGLFVYGIHPKNRGNLFAQTMLGASLAILYFTTYASFFIDTIQLFDNERAAIPALGACLLLLVVVCHIRPNQTSAGISLFLIYYTVVLSQWDSPDADNLVYSLITCAAVSLIAFLFHLTHRWLVFTWVALIASHLAYFFFFWAKPPELDMSVEAYFWVSNSYLLTTYILFSLACITDARKTGEYRNTVAPMAAVNSFVFLVLSWLSIREVYPEWDWAFRLGTATLLALFALYAEFSGPKRNYLFLLYIAKSVVMFTLALQAYLSHEWLLVAMAAECLALGLAYRRTGSTIFKALGLGLLAITFVNVLLSVRTPGEVQFGEYAFPANWFSAVGVAFLFCIVSSFYEHFGKRRRPANRDVKSQWFLAGSIIDVRGHTAAMLHAAAAALIMLFITIIDAGNNLALPFLLSGEAILMVLLGLMLRTAQVEVASVLLLIAAHVCYNVFFMLEKPGFEEQEAFALYTVMLALLTFLGGYLWERYLHRIKTIRPWEDDTLAAIPFLASTYMLAALMQRTLEPVYVPAGHVSLAVILFAACVATRLRGLRPAAVFALGAASVAFYTRLYSHESPISTHPNFLWVLAGVWIGHVLSERLIAHWRPDAVRRSSLAPTIRTVIVIVASVLAVVGLHEWAPQRLVTLYWVGLVVLTMALGVLIRESRYRWVAMAMALGAALRAYAYDLTNLSPIYKILSFVALGMLLLIISWGYSRGRGGASTKNSDITRADG